MKVTGIIKGYFVFSLLFVVMFHEGQAQTSKVIPDGIITAIRMGDANKLSPWFNSSVQLIILEKENVYSRSQATMIMKDFFKKHPPKSFTIIHEGGKPKARFGIGLLKTSDQTYRIYLLIKPDNNKSVILQLRIEKENG
jgi:hypothetical protein